MIIPGFLNIQFTESNGYLTAPMRLYNDQLNQSLQNGLSDNGWTVPALTTQQIETASSTVPNGLFVDGVNQVGMPVGTIWFDTTISKLKVKTSLTPGPIGTIETITSA